MGKISELPELDRPREKALRYGISSLSDAELLAILIASGYKGVSAIDIANNLLSTYRGLLGLYETDVGIYKTTKGIKNGKGLALQAAFELHRRISVKESDSSLEKVDSHFLAKRYRSELYHEDQETLVLVIINNKRQITYECVLYKGTQNEILFSFADLSKQLSLHRVWGFYLIHNHSHLSCRPSKHDDMLTREVKLFSKRRHYHFMDHIIIGLDGYYSFKEKNNFCC